MTPGPMAPECGSTGMANHLIAVWAMVIFFPLTARGSVTFFRGDPYDDEKVVKSVAADPEVVAIRAELDALCERMSKWCKHDFETMFGMAKGPIEESHAMFLCEPRVIEVSGINLDQRVRALHRLKAGWIEIEYFSPDHDTPSRIDFWIKADADLPKLDRARVLRKRLAREREILAAMKRELERRWREINVWEIDTDVRRTQFQGIDSGDFKEKLDALAELGKASGWRLEKKPATEMTSEIWNWTKGDALMGEFHHGRGIRRDKLHCTLFVRYFDDGWEREEGWPSLRHVRWQRGTHENGRWKDGGQKVRDEYGVLENGQWRPEIWIWYDKDGAVRSEWDANGDGVPETYLPGDHFSRKGAATFALPVEQSWAIHPELIPPECRIPGQDARRVPIRRIVHDTPADEGPEEPAPLEHSKPQWIFAAVVAVMVLVTLLLATLRRRSAAEKQ